MFISPSHVPDPRRHKTIALALSAALTVTIAYLTLMPLNVPPSMPGSDKAHHFIGFAVLTLPCAVLFPRALLWLLPAAVLFGGGIEIIQPSIGREGKWADFYADAIGAMSGVILGLILYRSLLRRTERNALRT